MPTEKARLRARLAAERARLLSQLLDVDERTLSCEPVREDWTAKDILGHVAAWDELFTQRIELALAGREANIGPVDPDAHDAVVHEERKGWSFERALDACLAARKAFLDSFARVPEEDLNRPLQVRSSSIESLRRWAELRYEHDADRSGDLAVWRQHLGAARSVGPKSLLVAALRASRKELLTAQALLPAADRETRPIQGQWTLKDVLAHIAEEERLCLDSLQQTAGTESPQRSLAPERKAWHHRNIAPRHDRSWEEVWRDLHATRQELLRLLISFNQSDLERSFPGSRDTQDTPYRWLRRCVDGDRERAAELHGELTA